MGRQLPQRYSLGDTVIVNQFSGFEKAIPAIPSLPGFRTSAGMFVFSGGRVTRGRHDVKNPLLYSETESIANT
jgi:hypothetical protein